MPSNVRNHSSVPVDIAKQRFQTGASDMSTPSRKIIFLARRGAIVFQVKKPQFRLERVAEVTSCSTPTSTPLHRTTSVRTCIAAYRGWISSEQLRSVRSLLYQRKYFGGRQLDDLYTTPVYYIFVFSFYTVNEII